MKKQGILLSFAFILLNLSAFAQVGGISASKVGALCTTPIDAGSIEFEPFFGYSISTHYFDSQGARQNLFATSDSTLKFSASGMRFSYGLMKNLELGVALPVDVSEIRFGAKYKLPFEGKFTMGLLGGYNTLIGNQVYTRRNAAQELTPSFVGGFIFSYVFSDKFSMDADAQFQKHTQITSKGHTHGFYFDMDAGYYFMEKVNFIVGLHYNTKIYQVNANNSHLLTLNTGLAIERARHFILVLNAPFDLAGKNEYQTSGFGLALTILLD